MAVIVTQSFDIASNKGPFSSGSYFPLFSTTSLTPIVPPTPVTSIGGMAIGADGTGAMAGLKMFAGDDFDSSLSIIGPSNPYGRYPTTRGRYITGSDPTNLPRGNSALGGADVDPLWTGNLDSNRGVPISSFSDMITQSGGVLTLNQRPATTAEQTSFAFSKPLAASMVDTSLYALARAPCAFEWLEQRAANTKSHMTGWLMQAAGFREDDDLELDWEADSNSGGGGDGTMVAPNVNVWDAGVRDSTESTPGTALAPGQATTNKYAFRIYADGTVEFYLNDSLRRTIATTKTKAKAIAKAFFLIFSNHSYAAGAAAWPGGSAPYMIYWYRIYGLSSYKPNVAPIIIKAASGASFSTTLPATTDVWGSAVTERVEAAMVEPNEPGGGTSYAPLPAGLTFDSGTYALGGTLTKPGQLHVARYVDTPGGVTEVNRIVIQIGPKMAKTVLPLVQNQAYNLYADCEVGILTPKTVTVPNPPASVTFNSGNTTLTGTTVGTFTTNITVQNGVNQTNTETVTIRVLPVGAVSYDSFTDTSGTSLAAHTSEMGEGWGTQPGVTSSAPLISPNNTLYSNGALGVLRNGGIRAADQWAELDIVAVTTPGSSQVWGVFVRGAESEFTAYVARYIGSGSYALQRFRAGAVEATLFTYTETLAAGQTKRLRVEAQGNQIRMKLDGTLLCDIDDTASVLSGSGRWGVRTATSGSSGSGLQADNFVGGLF